ncbi:hypothetical protein K490DRAFT_69969 [Saccharata proteae CBS 121410]|uniref:Uncharacterized protein n=1 Tax=Saccharata proteae CBS 121410 TaxID=1314787 RepID=A0A9P4LR79_9PEZI|nr:hypothetical protein K490DRAFT_69969 [Saccharata proteae CBS 121410]
MRTSFMSVFALSSLFLGAFAAPTQTEYETTAVTSTSLTTSTASNGVTTIEKQTTVKSVVEVLYTNVQTHTGSINNTVSALPASPSEDEKTDALTAIKIDIREICQLIVEATKTIIKIDNGKVDVDVDVDAILSIVVKIVLEVVCTLLAVVDVLGSSVLSLLGTVLSLLVSVIGDLLSVLENVLGSVIQTVWSVVTNLVPTVGDILVGLGDILNGECNCLPLGL